MRNFNAIKLGKGIRGKKSGDYNSTWPQLQISNRHLIPDKIISHVAGLTIHSDRIILPNGTANGQGGTKNEKASTAQAGGKTLLFIKSPRKGIIEVHLATCPNSDSRYLPQPAASFWLDKSLWKVPTHWVIDRAMSEMNEPEDREI